MKNLVRVGLAAFALGSCFFSLSPQASFAEAEKEAFPEEVQVGGYLDFYYSYDFNKPLRTSPPAPGAATTQPAPQIIGRKFDQYHNQFTLNLAEVSLEEKGREVEMKLDLDFGAIADTVAPLSPTDEVSKHIGEAVITYSPARIRGLSVSVGKMATHLGYETAKPRDNWQYSRSFLYTALPDWHLGAKVGYEWVPNRVSTTFYVYNGWNNLYETNGSKTYGGQLVLTFNEGNVLTYNVISGVEDSGMGAPPAMGKTQHEVNWVLTVSPIWSFAVDGLYGRQCADVPGCTSQTYRALTLALKWQRSVRFYVSPRVEFFSDPDGANFGTSQQIYQAGTLTLGWRLARGLEFRTEARYDRANQGTPFSADMGAATKNSQTTLLAAAMYSF